MKISKTIPSWNYVSKDDFICGWLHRKINERLRLRILHSSNICYLIKHTCFKEEDGTFLVWIPENETREDNK